MSGRRNRGCITRIFQLLFHPRHPLPPPPAPRITGQNAIKGNELGFTADKTPVNICNLQAQKKVVKEKQYTATESSTTSLSSSCSSTFSSVESDKKPHSEPLSSCHNIFPETQSPNFPVSQTHSSIYREARVVSVKKEDGKGRAMKHIDSPRPLVQSKPHAPPRYSCDGTASQYSLKSTVTIKDLPRLSLDSRAQSIRSGAAESRSNYLLVDMKMENEPGSNKRPSGVVARLMGLEAFPDSTSQYQENIKRVSRSGDQVKQKIPAVYGETERRNKEKRPSNVNTLENKYGQKNKASRFEIGKGQNGNVLLSPTITGTSPPRRNLIDKKTVTKTQSMPLSSKVPECVTEKPASVRRKSATVSLTRLRQKRNGVEKQERKKSPSSDSRKERKQPSKQKMESRSPTRRLKSKSIDVKSRNLSHYSDSVSVQSESSINSDPKDKIFGASLTEEKSINEQPSPVSVLDATFYGEGSLSPVNKISNTFQDDEGGDSIEVEWDKVDIDHLLNGTRPILGSKLNNQLVLKLILSNPSDDDKANIDHTAALYSTNPDYRYITNILLASGFLQDSSTNQLHPPGHFIDADLFHVLEKTERETEHTDDEQKRNIPKSKSNNKIPRKLLFDAVNEIIGHKLASPGSSIFPKKLERRRSSGEKVVEEVWSEIVKLQSWGECRLDDEDEDDELRRILSADMMNQSNEWTGCSGEFSGLVLDIERLIFKDLIREVVNGGSADRQRRHCTQLLSM